MDQREVQINTAIGRILPETIGRSVLLNDVLFSIKEAIRLSYFNDSFPVSAILNKQRKEIGTICLIWNLKDQNLHSQTVDCKEYIYSILCV